MNFRRYAPNCKKQKYTKYEQIAIGIMRCIQRGPHFALVISYYVLIWLMEQQAKMMMKIF